MSKTLGVVNQVIPIYKEAKPIIQNARNTMNLIKEFTNSSVNKIIEKKEKNVEPLKQIINKTNNKYNNPTFFQ